jgi:phenylacetate-coenzyme A ligase PaaK-like adenylate-forming protein
MELSGTCLLVGGEALTAERRAAIREAGAYVGGIYAAIEGGTIALGCPNSAADEEEDYHVRMEDFGVIAAPRRFQTGSPLLITCLTLSAGKILLNTELGDTAEIHEERCGCYFESLGMRRHLRAIRSTSKFTAEGMTLLKSDVNHVLEGVLPKKHGGVPGDYQLVQRRGPDGMEFLDLWVSPDVPLGENSDVVKTFLEEIGRLDMSYRIVTDVWSKAGTVRVVRSRPVRAAGKDPSVQIGRS